MGGVVVSFVSSSSGYLLWLTFAFASYRSNWFGTSAQIYAPNFFRPHGLNALVDSGTYTLMSPEQRMQMPLTPARKMPHSLVKSILSHKSFRPD